MAELTLDKHIPGAVARKKALRPARLRVLEIAHASLRFGYQRIHIMLRREGWKVNRKRMYR